MKKQVKKILFCGLGLSIFSTQSAPMCVSKEQCTGSDDQQSCYRVAAGMYQTSYPWLNEFIWKTTFPETALKMSAQNLDTLVQQMLEENLLEPNDPDFFPGFGESIQTWNKPEESADYLQISTEDYGMGVGAAHGNGSTTYYVFKKSNHSQITGNIVLPHAEQKLSLLLQKAFIQALIDHPNNPMSLAEAKEIAHSPIEPSEKWHFAKNAIVFDYNPYEIASYAFGDFHLPIPVAELKGLVREDILQAAHQWPIPYQSYDNNSDYDDCISVNDESL